MHELTNDLDRIAGGAMFPTDSGTDVPPRTPPADPVFRYCRTNGPG